MPPSQPSSCPPPPSNAPLSSKKSASKKPATLHHSLHHHLSLSLANSGILDTVTAQLRTQIINNLSQHTPGNAHPRPPPPPQAATLPMLAINSFILQYLKTNGFVRTMSVFAPESRIGARALSEEECWEVLGGGGEVPEGGLETVIERGIKGSMASRGKENVDQTNAMDDSPNTPMSAHTTHVGGTHAVNRLSTKLNELESNYTAALELLKSGPMSSSVSDKMVGYQREVERKVEEKWKKDMERWKVTELEDMRVRERSAYRNEISGVRGILKADYEKRLDERMRVEAGKVVQHQQLRVAAEEAKYVARQELGRELETMRREKVERDKMIDMRMKMMEIDAAKNKNKQELLAKKEEEIERKESEVRMLYQTEFERGRHEGRHSYSQACENVDSVRKQLDEELEGARNAREELRRQTTEVEEQQRLYLGQDTDLPKVRLERDSLKVKLSEIEGQLKAFQVDYDKDKDITSDTNFDDVIGMSSPSVGGTPNLSRQRSSSQIVLQDVNRTWKDHRMALESDLNAAEGKLEEIGRMLGEERERGGKLRRKEREAFERAVTLEAVAKSLEDRLGRAEKEANECREEKQRVMFEHDKIKVEVSELRVLLSRSNEVSAITKREKKRPKDEMREARLEKVRQRAREQMKIDVDILKEEKEVRRADVVFEKVVEVEKTEKGRDEGAKVVWDYGRPIAVGWDASVGGLVLKQPYQPQQQQQFVQQVPQYVQQASVPSGGSERVYGMLAMLEERLKRGEEERRELERRLEGQEVKKVVAAVAQEAPRVPQVSQAVTVNPPAKSTSVSPVTTTKPGKRAGWESEYQSYLEDEVQRQEAEKEELKVAVSPVTATKPGKRAGWENEYQSYLEDEDQRLEAEKEQLKKVQLQQFEQKKKLQEAENKLLAQQAERAVKRQEAESKRSEEDIVRAGKKQAEGIARAKKEKEEGEERRWEANEEKRKEEKRIRDEERKVAEEKKQKLALEKEEEEEEEERKISASVMIQAHGRRRSAASIVATKKREKEASMSKVEKARMEREKAKAVEDAKKKIEEDSKRSEVEEEHAAARARAAERMRARAQEAEAERRAQEEEEGRDRRLSAGGAESPLEVSDDLESFDSEDNGIDDDW